MRFNSGHALLVGVGADMPITAEDAKAIQKVLIDPERAAYPTDQVEVLTEAQATREGILAGFDRLIARVAASPGATALVYFSGHGGKLPSGEETNAYLLVPYDFDASDPFRTSISGRELTERITAIEARKLVVFLDCCHAAGMPKRVGTAFVKSPAPPELLALLSSGAGQVVIASSRADELSYTGERFSTFTECLLDALAGRALVVPGEPFVRILEVVVYLFREVPRRAPAPQHPFVNRIEDLDENFPLCLASEGKQVALDGSASAAPITLSTGQRERLLARRKTLQEEWGLRNKKERHMRRQLAIEASPAQSFQIEQELVELRGAISRVQEELDEIDRDLEENRSRQETEIRKAEAEREGLNPNCEPAKANLPGEAEDLKRKVLNMNTERHVPGPLAGDQRSDKLRFTQGRWPSWGVLGAVGASVVAITFFLVSQLGPAGRIRCQVVVSRNPVHLGDNVFRSFGSVDPVQEEIPTSPSRPDVVIFDKDEMQFLSKSLSAGQEAILRQLAGEFSGYDFSSYRHVRLVTEGELIGLGLATSPSPRVVPVGDGQYLIWHQDVGNYHQRWAAVLISYRIDLHSQIKAQLPPDRQFHLRRATLAVEISHGGVPVGRGGKLLLVVNGSWLDLSSQLRVQGSLRRETLEVDITPWVFIDAGNSLNEITLVTTPILESTPVPGPGFPDPMARPVHFREVVIHQAQVWADL